MAGVSQISPPMRIVLVVVVAFLGIYVMFLRPRTEVAPVAPAPAPAGNVNTGKPAVTGPGKAVEAAKGAVAATERQQAAEGRNAGVTPATRATGTATTPATKPAHKAARPAPAGPAVDTAGLPAPVARAIAAHKVLALLFTNEVSADDRAVQVALRHAGHTVAGVFVRVAPVGTIARYGRITRGADVQQSPTLVVVDRKLRATTLVGYVDALTSEQASGDAARASRGALHAPFLRSLDGMTSSVAHDLNRLPVPVRGEGSQYARFLRSADRRFARYVRAVGAIPAGRRWRGVKRASLSDLARMRSARDGLAWSLGAHPTRAKLDRLVPAAVARDAAASERFTARAKRLHLVSVAIPGLPSP